MIFVTIIINFVFFRSSDNIIVTIAVDFIICTILNVIISIVDGKRKGKNDEDRS